VNLTDVYRERHGDPYGRLPGCTPFHFIGWLAVGAVGIVIGLKWGRG
jgi:hypothetical protein